MEYNCPNSEKRQVAVFCSNKAFSKKHSAKIGTIFWGSGVLIFDEEQGRFWNCDRRVLTYAT